MFKQLSKLFTLKNILIVVFSVGIVAALYMVLYGDNHYPGYNWMEGFESGADCAEDGDCDEGEVCENSTCLKKESFNNEGDVKEDKKEEKDEPTVEPKGETFMNATSGSEVAAAVQSNENILGIESSSGYADIGSTEGTLEMPKVNNPASCLPRDSLNPNELLPKEQGEYAAFAPMGQGSLTGRNFLEAGKLIGIDTVGQSLRNANYQLRSEPPNPQVSVSPFNNTTIAADTARRQLEIGSN